MVYKHGLFLTAAGLEKIMIFLKSKKSDFFNLNRIIFD